MNVRELEIERKELEKKREGGSVLGRDKRHKSSQSEHLSVLQESVPYNKVIGVPSGSENDFDTFNENFDEYLEDLEDEITYPPEIYDTLIDNDEEGLIMGGIYY